MDRRRLPTSGDRPVNAHRYPDGVHRPGFWHEEVPDHAPRWLHRWHNTRGARRTPSTGPSPPRSASARNRTLRSGRGDRPG
ncbi:MAG TPA: hypothetical protein VH969_23185 [Actinophytocola sp.]|uniref:non-homologous end-joining DNA ligase LigD n=1 Tax=Actinophytocola sp. TaxID=1872138 RepID=UPI002F945FEE